MRYFRVKHTGPNGSFCLSDPIAKWTDAEAYRREIGGDAEILSY